MEYKNVKILVLISVVCGIIITISMWAYASGYYIAGDVSKGVGYYLMFSATVIIIESLALFILCPILYLRLRNKGK